MNGVEETLFDFVSKSKFQKLSLKMSFATSPLAEAAASNHEGIRKSV